MRQILVLGGGASGLAAALAAAQRAGSSAQVTVIERNARVGKKLLATGNGRCNLDNQKVSPGMYFTAQPDALAPLLATVEQADPITWFDALGLFVRADEAGRVYPYSNQAADVLALLEAQLARRGVTLRTGCAVRTLAQRRNGYAVQIECRDGTTETLPAGAVICALGGEAGPQFGTDGFGLRFAQACGGKMEPSYPCLTALQCVSPIKELAGVRVKATASLLQNENILAQESGEVQFADYGLSGICIMQLSCYLRPERRTAGQFTVELDLFPELSEDELAFLFYRRVPNLPGSRPADFWHGLLHPQVGRALWSAAGLPDGPVQELTELQWCLLAHTAKHWRFPVQKPCGWKQAQSTGGGLSLTELEPESFGFKGCPGLYFVGETLDCVGTCGGYNLHWAFGSGIVAGRSAADFVCRQR